MSRFRPIDRQTDYLLPPSVQEWLPETHLARYVVDVVEALDLFSFLSNHSYLISRRIAEAAATLFAENGYARTTMQQVAAAADVADGTIFRYAGTKPELLLMVLNEQVADLLEHGRIAAASAPTVADAVVALIGPLVALVRAQPDNAAPYLREVLFGEAGPHRDEALAVVDGDRKSVV